MYVRRLRAEGTVEERIFEIQMQKAQLSADALSETGAVSGESKLTQEQLRSFFTTTEGEAAGEDSSDIPLHQPVSP